MNEDNRSALELEVAFRVFVKRGFALGTHLNIPAFVLCLGITCS